MSYHEGSLPLSTVEHPPHTVPVPDAPTVSGETIPRRHPKARDGLLFRPAPEVDTIFALLKRSAEKYADEPAVGSRRLLGVHKEVTRLSSGVEKEWTYYELSEYEYMTYKEYYDFVLKLGAGLRKLGMEAGEVVHLFAATSANWLAMSHACASQSMTIATAYDTLGEKGVAHSLAQTRAAAMFVDPHLISTAMAAHNIAFPSSSSTPSPVRYLIYNDASTISPPPSPDTLSTLATSYPSFKILSISSLLALGTAHPIPPTPPSPSSPFCIMYTSGSGSGTPKGCLIPHSALVAAVAGTHAVEERVVSHRDFILAYLPLAHIFELTLENLVLFFGATLGYGNARTLADTSVRVRARNAEGDGRDETKLAPGKGDIRAFAPTILIGVPAIWETLRKGVLARVASASLPLRTLFHAYLAAKSALTSRGLPVPLASTLDNVIFGAVRRNTGGRLRFLVNGASALALPTRNFMSMVVAPMVGGYGLTETCGCGALGTALQWGAATRDDAVGTIPASIEVKLVSVPSLGYIADPSPSHRPQGEILLRGPAVMQEYYKNEEETKRAFTSDGWFRTGDVGEFTEGGHLRVIDRVKNMVKLQGGEYVALEKLEAVYRTVGVVELCMVYGGAECARPVAVCSVNGRAVGEVAGRLGVEEGDVLRDPKVKAHVLRELVDAGRRAGLSSLEIVSAVVLVGDEWTPASGLVTATQKLNRRALNEKYAQEIKDAIGNR